MVDRRAFCLGEYAAVFRTRIAIIRGAIQVVVTDTGCLVAQSVLAEVFGAGVAIVTNQQCGRAVPCYANIVCATVPIVTIRACCFLGAFGASFESWVRCIHAAVGG